MGVSNANKELSTQIIDCGDRFTVKLSLTAEPDIVTNPTDIVLILDRSGTCAWAPDHRSRWPCLRCVCPKSRLPLPAPG